MTELLTKLSLIFEGHTRVYLQGKLALQPFGDIVPSVQNYYIGAETTNIVIRDHRSAPVLAADKAIRGLEIDRFPDIFNEPAYVEIHSAENIIEIDLFETTVDHENIILWLGVIDNHQLPIHYLTWNIFVPMDGDQIAFAALVQD